jgi:probable F420-dependent oxidoreductase
VKAFAGMDPRLPLRDVPAYARRIEAMGFDGLHVAETVHDALAVALLVAEHTERITIRTSVALAFVRSPTLTAYAAWDLSAFSGGRFELGLGTQIRPNVTERMGMPWSEPVPRMREYLDVLDGLYEAFRTGGRPHVEGDVYSVTRLQPYFNPGPDTETVAPPTWLGGVNAGICELAGERAAGFITHPTNSNPRYLEAICLPHLRAGAERAGRPLPELVVGATVVTGATEADVVAERERQRRLFAFLYSTPAYARTLELHGWDDLGGELRALVRADRWDDLPALVTDELLDTLLPTGTYDELAAVLLDRFAGLADGILLGPQPDRVDDEGIAGLIADLKARAGR